MDSPRCTPLNRWRVLVIVTRSLDACEVAARADWEGRRRHLSQLECDLRAEEAALQRALGERDQLVSGVERFSQVSSSMEWERRPWDVEDPYEELIKFDVETYVDAIHQAEAAHANYQWEVGAAKRTCEVWANARALARVEYLAARRKIFAMELRARYLQVTVREWSEVTRALRRTRDEIAAIPLGKVDFDLLHRLGIEWWGPTSDKYG
eukprot:GEMP01057132.1.p1 GENE.GEMP01057132.1~~GEMP01057132.1.p1  ORF type:complete len:209 (+),score=60.20 GEMP01057132.1:95-721(+)